MPLPQLAHALLWLLAPAQDAAPPDDALARWRAPPECPDRRALLTAVTRRLGRPLAPGEVTIDAAVAGDASHGYTLDLTLTAGPRRETREIHDPSCAALADAAALRVVAVIQSAPVIPPAPETTTNATTDAPANVAPALTTPPEPLAPALPARVVPVQPPEAPVPKASQPRIGGVLRLHGGPELGAVPKVTGAVGLALGLLWPRLRLELHGTILAPRTAPRPPGAVQAGLYTGAAFGCGRLGRGSLEIPLCAGLEVGVLRGKATGLPESQAAAVSWLAAVLGPGLAWQVGPRLGIWASLQLVLALRRPIFQQGSETLFKPALASGRLLVGVELRLRDPW